MICPRCKQEPVEQIYHTKQRKGSAHPVGSPGLHVRRMICACGCKSVDLFRLLDYDKSRTRATDSTPRQTKSEKQALLVGNSGGVYGYA